MIDDDFSLNVHMFYQGLTSTYHFERQSTASLLTSLLLSSRQSDSCLITKDECGLNTSLERLAGNWAIHFTALMRTAICLLCCATSRRAGINLRTCWDKISGASATAMRNVSKVDIFRLESSSSSDSSNSGMSCENVHGQRFVRFGSCVCIFSLTGGSSLSSTCFRTLRSR